MFNENFVNLLKDRFHECLKDEKCAFQPEFYPHIQEKHQEKVMKHFVEKRCEDETILMLFDTSMFSKGKNGLVITDQAVYFRDMMTKPANFLIKNWDPVRDQSEKLLGITEYYTFLMAPFLDKLISDIVTLKKYEGLFDAEESNAAEKAAAEKAEAERIAAEKAAAEKAEAEKAAAEKAEAEKVAAGEAVSEKKAEDEEKDDDEGDDDDVGLLDILGVVMDVTSDPTYEK